MELIEAARLGNIELVKELLDQGVDIESKDPEYGSTALMFVSQQSNGSSSLEMVKLLLDRGADVNANIKKEQPL